MEALAIRNASAARAWASSAPARAEAVSPFIAWRAAYTTVRSTSSLPTYCVMSEYRPLASDASRTRSRIFLRQHALNSNKEDDPDDTDVTAAKGPPTAPRAVTKP
jgi:hypothetical protein